MATARRTVAQRAATARLVATNAARRAGGAIATRTRTVIQRVRSAPRVIRETVRAPRRARRAAAALGRAATATAIAQARILPAAVGGYMMAKAERNQRKAQKILAEATANKTTPTSKPLIVDPQTRLLVELGALAFVASRTNGMMREAACGAVGAVGAMYEMYTSNEGTNPVDNYLQEVKGGGTGV